MLVKVASLTILGTIIASAIVLVPKKDRTTVVGWICGVVNIVMHAAPLSVVVILFTNKPINIFLQLFTFSYIVAIIYVVLRAEPSASYQ